MTRKTYCGNLLWQSGPVGSQSVIVLIDPYSDAVTLEVLSKKRPGASYTTRDAKEIAKLLAMLP